MNRKSQVLQTLIVTAVVAIASAVLRSAQDPLSAAKDLYASAAYEDALSTLSRINARRCSAKFSGFVIPSR